MLITRAGCFVGFVLLFMMTSAVSKAQGVCVVPTLKVSSAKGKVLSRQEGVPRAFIELRDWSDQTKKLATTLTDVEGNFDFKNVKKGKYLLVVSRKLFSSLHVPIHVHPKTKNKVEILLIHLALDSMDPCAEGGGELKLVATDSGKQFR